MMNLRIAKIAKNRLKMYSKKTIKKLKDYFAKHDQKPNSNTTKKDSNRPPAGKDGKGRKC
jgi:hypothetical protein